jgi:hypothetical protein
LATPGDLRRRHRVAFAETALRHDAQDLITGVWSARLVTLPFVAIGFPSLPATGLSTDSAALLSRWLGETKSTRDLGDRIFAAVRLALKNGKADFWPSPEERRTLIDVLVAHEDGSNQELGELRQRLEDYDRKP